MMEIDGAGATPSQPGALFNYCVTAHKPTAVIASVVGNFTGPNDVNLIIAKSTQIEVHKLTPHGLELVMDLPIFGRVSCIELFRPKSKLQDNLFVLVEKYKICILECDTTTGEPITRAHGDVRDQIGVPSQNGQLCMIDPKSRAIAMHLYDGLIKIIPLGDRGRLLDAFNARIDELSVIGLCFLEGTDRPTLAVLYEDAKHARHVKTYVIGFVDKELIEGPWNQQNVDPGSGLIIAVPKPLGGVIVVGESIVVYLSGDGNQPVRATPVGKPTIFQAFGAIDPDGSRYLLGDCNGNLYLMVLAHDQNTALGITVEIVGHTSSASSISYLDKGFVFVGSKSGDSQLVRLHPEAISPQEPHNHVEVVDSYTNLGPIVDLCVVDPEGQGQGQVVACCGRSQDGSLRIVRNGIGINEQASVDLHGMKGVWSLRQSWADAFDKYLVLTFVGDTRVLAINADDELDEAEIAGFDAGSQTLYCGNTRYDQLLQVTANGVRLVSASEGHALLSSWSPPAGLHVNVAAGGPTQVLLATGSGHLIYLEVTEAGALEERAAVKMDCEIACLDITSLAPGDGPSTLAAVGTWSLQLHLLSLPGLTPLRTEELGGEVIPRSVLMNSFDGSPYCLVGLGDGQLLTWRLDVASGGLSERKRVLLGTKPLLLKTFCKKGVTNVFAGSDRPTIIYSSNKKVVFSNLNENEVHLMASFNSASFPDCLAIAKENSLTIGTVEEIQKLHVRTVPLKEQPRRIVHQESTKTFGVVTIAAGTMLDDEQGYLRILDDSSYETVASYALQASEWGVSVASVTFSDTDPTAYYVLGTAFVRSDEPEPNKGRIVVLQYSGEERQLTVVTEREVKGAVYQVLPFQSKLLITCNNKVQLHKMVAREDGSKELRPDCSHGGNIIALYLAARGDFIVVGDLMRSVSLLVYKPEEETLELRASDSNTNWTTAVEMLDDDTFVAAENSYNIYVLRKNSDAATEEERGRLEVVGEYHTGEFINRFRRGSLVMKLPDSEVATFPTLLYGTVDGSIGVMATIPQPWFEFLSTLQDAMRKVVRGVGGWDHASFRTFSNERKTSPARGFVDGDLIGSFLDQSKEKQAQIVALMGPEHSVEEVMKKVEELTQGLGAGG